MAIYALGDVTPRIDPDAFVHPDATGRARTDKAMYVSPFHGTDGWYDLAVPFPGDRLDVAVTLHSDDPRWQASADDDESVRPTANASAAVTDGRLSLTVPPISWSMVRFG